ncbi:Mbov_0399 family ICE element protein [Candidatus Mycoplasma pogonae]
MKKWLINLTSLSVLAGSAIAASVAMATKSEIQQNVGITNKKWGRLDDYKRREASSKTEYYYVDVPYTTTSTTKKTTRWNNLEVSEIIENPNDSEDVLNEVDSHPNHNSYKNAFSVQEKYLYTIFNGYELFPKVMKNFDSNGNPRLGDEFSKNNGNVWKEIFRQNIWDKEGKRAYLNLKFKDFEQKKYLPNLSHKHAEEVNNSSFYEHYNWAPSDIKNNYFYTPNDYINYSLWDYSFPSISIQDKSSISLKNWKFNLGSKKIDINNIEEFVNSLSLQIYSNSQFIYKKELINGLLKNKIMDKLNENNSLSKNKLLKIKNINFNIDTKWNFAYNNGVLYWPYRVIRADAFKVNVSFDYQWEYEEETSSTLMKREQRSRVVPIAGDELGNSNKQQEWKNNYNRNFLSGITVESDTGWDKGFWTRSSRGMTSNRQKYEEAINKWLTTNISPEDREKYKIKLVYFAPRDEDRIYNWLEFLNPDNGKYEKIKLSSSIGEELKFEESDIFKRNQASDIEDRLEIIPGKYVDLNNTISYNLIDDKPIIIEAPSDKYIPNDEGVLVKNGGTYRYNTTAKVRFQALLKENEVLEVNDIVIDVLDQNFIYDLKDLRTNDKDNQTKNQNYTNKYVVKVVEYQRDNVNGLVGKKVREYYKTIIIDGLGANLNSSWFGWNPEINPDQNKLIQPFLLDENGQPLKDRQNKKIPNPDYDPEVDPETGIKNKIYWIRYKNGKTIPKDTHFPQDNLNSINEPISAVEDLDFGFIANGATVGKGVNINPKLPQEADAKAEEVEAANKAYINALNTKRWFINKNAETFELIETKRPLTDANGTIIKLSDDEKKNYFSYSGAWMFTMKPPSKIDNFYLNYIGNNSPTDNFKDMLNTNNIEVMDFWEGSLQGKHLLRYLRDKYQIDFKNAKLLKYNEVVRYWLEYVQHNAEVFGQTEFVVPSINEQGLRDLAKTAENFEDFFKNHNWRNFITIPDKYQPYTNISIAMDPETKHQLNIQIVVSGGELDIIYQLDPAFENYHLSYFYFAETYKENAHKKEIKPSVQENTIREEALLRYYDEPLSTWIQQSWINGFENSDKVNISFEKSGVFGTDIKINYQVKEKFEKDYWIANPSVIIRSVNYADKLANGSEYVNIFNRVPGEINLHGLTDLAQAREYVKQEITKWINPKYEWNKDYFVNNFDAVVNQAVSKIYQFKDEDLPTIGDSKFTITLRVNPERLDLIGSKRVFVFNAVDNVNVPEIKDISQYKFNAIKMNTKVFAKMDKLIIDSLNKDLEKYGILFNEWMQIIDYEVVKSYLLDETKQDENGIVWVKAIIKPKNFLLSGENSVFIGNNLKRADDETYDPHTDPDFKVPNNPNDVPVIGDGNNGGGGEKNGGSFDITDTKNLAWVVTVAVVLGIGLIVLGFKIHYRWGRGAKIKK